MNFITPLFLQKLIWIPTRLTLLFFARLKVAGLENLKDVGPGGVIFALNHTSELDPILLPAALPFWSRFSPMFYMSRESKFYKNSGWRKHFYGGWFFKIWGSYPVYTGLKDYEKSLRHHLEIIASSGSLCVFPEGKITDDGRVQPAHGGVAYLAERTRRPIVPVAVSGSFHIGFWGFVSGKRRITVSFGAPVYQQELRERVASISVPGTHVYREEANYVMSKVSGMLPRRAVREKSSGERVGGRAGESIGSGVGKVGSIISSPARRYR